MGRQKYAKTIALEDQIMAFLVQHWPACYTVGEIANAFEEAGWKVPNWGYCSGRNSSECKERYNSEYYDYVHNDHLGIDQWTYTPMGSDIGPRLNELLKLGLVIKIPPFNGGRTNSWHAENNTVLKQKAAIEAMEILLEVE